MRLFFGDLTFPAANMLFLRFCSHLAEGELSPKACANTFDTDLAMCREPSPDGLTGPTAKLTLEDPAMAQEKRLPAQTFLHYEIHCLLQEWAGFAVESSCSALSGPSASIGRPRMMPLKLLGNLIIARSQHAVFLKAPIGPIHSSSCQSDQVRQFTRCQCGSALSRVNVPMGFVPGTKLQKSDAVVCACQRRKF